MVKKLDPNILAHLEWLGFVQPTGLVVSAPALVRAGALLNRRDTEGQRRLHECIAHRVFDPNEGETPWVPDFRTFAEHVLGWSFSPKWYAGIDSHPIPSELEVFLPEYGEFLHPHFAVREPDPRDTEMPWQLLITILDAGDDFDRVTRNKNALEASAHGRMERLLRRTGVAAGLLFNGRALRLLSAPHGESSGWLDFQVADMLLTAGRPMSAALRMLLSERRLLTLPRKERLPALLEDSRNFQNEVSERLAQQVLHALYELLRGLQAAHDASSGELLHDPLREQPDEVYRALLIVILRIVFLLYAGERDMLPEDENFQRYYSIAGLHDRLREDAALYPDTMDQRYGAWAQLLVLFRLIHDGAASGSLQLPARHGVLFDPDRYTFLEGRNGARQIHERIEAPLIPDGAIYRALEKLLVLNGERISYRALDVEQIGSVYETMMGFRLETATGPSIAIKAAKKHGAPTTFDLQKLLAIKSGNRAKWIREQTDRKITTRINRAVKEASTLEDLHASLESVIDRRATPDLVSKGAMVLQPSEERRRSGSHYTPRSLTEPIVRTTIEPILNRLKEPDGRPPQPAQILNLKVCDPAMGSGAFLVEVCRQLGDALVEAWHAHDEVPKIPADEDEVIFARRLVAQRCLYGVDRNPVAVDLAKVSLWLVTLARDHSLTFVDHALRHGDSLVGLTRRQIEAMDWDPSKPTFHGLGIREPIDRMTNLRQQIREADEGVSDRELRDLWDEAQQELKKARLLGDLVVAAFFDGQKKKEREAQRSEYASAVARGDAGRYRYILEVRRHAEPPLAPFHWEIEFPEVFDRENPGFDAFVGNPPFAGKNTVAAANEKVYPVWLKYLHAESHGNADLVAHFYRRAFDMIRHGGTLGLIATNTIAQGDTRSTGLRWICKHGGEIYCARRRVKWPGVAAVVVSVLHITKGVYLDVKKLDDREVETITAFLSHRGAHDDPIRIGNNANKSFQGSIVLGMGFTFDDSDTKGVATPLAEMRRLIEEDPSNEEVIFPYIGGEEVNATPTHAHHRYVIDFRDRGEGECRKHWPDLMKIVEAKVKPERTRQHPNGKYVLRQPLPKRWWHHAEKRPALYAAIAGLEQVLVCAGGTSATKYLNFAFLDNKWVYSQTLCVFPLTTNAAFCTLQSRPHEIWARFSGSTLEDRLRYNSLDVFETFPFPEGWETHPALESTGKTYYEFRAALMVRIGEGLTKTYNRFHNPGERNPDILKLRELHTAMDRAVLDAYGWKDIPTDCEFLLDYEIDEEEWGKKKKPYRYRWPDEIHDEVLARLLELNAARAAEEARLGLTGKKNQVGRAGKKKQPANPSNTIDLFS